MLFFFGFFGEGEAIAATNAPDVTRSVLAQTWRVLRSDLPDKLEGETVRVAYDLTAALGGTRTVDSVTWSATGTGLALTDSAVTNSGTRVEVTLSGGTWGNTHQLKATCTLSNGGVVEPWATIRVKRAGD